MFSTSLSYSEWRARFCRYLLSGQTRPALFILSKIMHFSGISLLTYISNCTCILVAILLRTNVLSSLPRRKQEPQLFFNGPQQLLGQHNLLMLNMPSVQDRPCSPCILFPEFSVYSSHLKLSAHRTGGSP